MPTPPGSVLSARAGTSRPSTIGSRGTPSTLRRPEPPLAMLESRLTTVAASPLVPPQARSV